MPLKSKPAQETKNMMVVFSVSLVGANLYFFRTIIGPFVLGLALAYTFFQTAQKLARYKIPYAFSCFFLVGLFFSILSLFLLHLIPFLEQLIDLGQSLLPAQLEELHDRLIWFLFPFGKSANQQANPDHPLLVHFYSDTIGRNLAPALSPEHLKQALHHIAQWASKILTQALQSTRTIEIGLFYACASPLVAYYFLKDWPRLLQFGKKVLPLLTKGNLTPLWSGLEQVMKKALKGQFLICFVMGAFYTACFWTMHLPFAFTLGPLAGLLLLIPYLGILFSLFFTAMVTLVFDADTPDILWVILTYFSGHMIKTFFLHRWTVKKNNLHPAWVFFMVFGSYLIFGPIGTFLSLPLAALGQVLFHWILQAHTAEGGTVFPISVRTKIKN